MKNWILLAFISMIFAGITSVVAKMGMSKVSSDTGLAVRTMAVMLVVAVNSVFFNPFMQDAGKLTLKDIAILSASGITAGLSWIFYFRAVKLGDVSQVALIDKGSIVLTVLLSVLILGEQFTWKTAVGGTLIVAGFLVLSLK
ncbi:EamA family transporter [Flavobacterium sp. MAH-1]|uniref:EamA family transporter n=1 Tax=Flavobacterium agri TaxID=2743471 RepID=A0A7Y8Y0L0_9FLAO|nr:EamA family transporter [Flavobacterium agri]NUY79723.1 EamA family transporter [Flavobacterium agri]NYA69748.1 EamA family transporter [Flavobacterium agri]